MHPGPNIKAKRKALGWTLEQLAGEIERYLGKPVNTGNLSRLERAGQGYSDELLQAAAQALKIPVSQLFTASLGQGVVAPVRVEPVLGGLRTDRSQSYAIPVLDIEGSMGVGRAQPEYETVVGQMEVSPAWVHSNLPNITKPENLKVITGYGDSMEGTFNDGDVLFVDTGVQEIRIDAVYVFALNHELYIKRLQRRPDGSITIISDNKKYEPYVVDQREDLSVMGRVVWAWNGKKL